MADDYSEYGAIPYDEHEKYSEYGAIPYDEEKKSEVKPKEKEKFFKRTPIQKLGDEFLAGGVQGLANIPAGLINLPIKALNTFGGQNIPEVPRFNFAPESTASSLGNVASFFAAPNVGRAAGLAAESIPGIASALSKGKDILNKIPDLVRSVTGNALLGGAYAPKDTAMGVGLGAAAPFAGKAVNAIKNINPQFLNPKNYLPENIANKILTTAKQNESIYNKKYGQLWDEAKKSGHNNVENVAKKIDLKTLRKTTPAAERKLSGVIEFVENPTLENAHFAKSDLTDIQRALSKETTSGTHQYKQEKAINNALKEIRDNLFKNKSGDVSNELLSKYNELQSGFKKEVIPYRHKAIKEYEAGEKLPEELVNSLSKGKFMAQRGKHHPELKIRKYLPGIGKTALGGLGAYGIYEGAHGIKNILSGLMGGE